VAVSDPYLETRVLTAPPHQLHLMVVDGALRFSRQAAAALEQRDFETAHFSLNRARDCVNELIVGLKPDQDPDMVDRLKGLFIFAHRNLAQADLVHEPRLIHEAIRILEMHRETWVELIENLPKEQALQPVEMASRSWTT